MNASIHVKLESLAERRQELNALLADPAIIGIQDQFRALSIELADITPVVTEYERYRAVQAELDDLTTMAADPDPAIRQLAEAESPRLQERLNQTTEQLQKLLLPRDPNDNRNLFLEIRAGTGGDEAGLFAGDLFRMYHTYALARGWMIEVLSRSDGEHGGYKEIISRIAGRGTYSRLKFESGVHRVQRVPATEAQGRIHTSACTVAVLPEADDIDDTPLNPGDLRIDTYRASGAGGQHVNKTDSAIRITHLPTGMVVECQDERSQHKNRARAMSILKARLFEAEQRKQREHQAETRRSLVGSGDRSERIRTYNFPQGRVTDHRINLTLYKLDEIIGGNLDPVIEPLIAEHQADQLAALASG